MRVHAGDHDDAAGGPTAASDCTAPSVMLTEKDAIDAA